MLDTFITRTIKVSHMTFNASAEIHSGNIIDGLNTVHIQIDYTATFITNEMINMNMIKVVICLSIGIYAVSYVVWYFVNLKLFKKGVNVD